MSKEQESYSYPRHLELPHNAEAKEDAWDRRTEFKHLASDCSSSRNPVEIIWIY